MTIRIWKGTDTGPEFFDESWTGLVLATGEHNYYDDSDFYALVWDADAGEPREITYASTRGWTYYNSATVDATDDTKAAYLAWADAKRAANAEAAARRDARIPYTGRRVRVVKGRKVPVGTEGEVFWYGVDKFARRYRTSFLDDGREGYRVGIVTDDGTKHFTSAANTEVVRETATVSG